METTDKTQSLGDRMKGYEESSRSFVDHTLPVIIRLDGHAFSKFTRGLKKPYEEWMHQIMVKVTGQLVNDFNAVIGYTQSDEITLVLMPHVLEGVPQHYIYNNQIQKLVSLAASNATNLFTMELLRMIYEKKINQEDYKKETYNKLMNARAYFDGRIFNVPNLTECYNNIYWRSNYDCVRNSISGAAQANFSHKVLQNLNSKQLLEKLMEKGIDWEAMDPEFKYGTFIKKKIVMVDMKGKEKNGKQKEDNEEEKEQEDDQEKEEKVNEKKDTETPVQRKKLWAFTLKMPKYEEKYEQFVFAKYYQEDNEEMRKLVCKEYQLE